MLNALILRGLGSGVSVLFTILVARFLDDEGAAHFFLLFNVSLISAICFRWGMDEVIIRRIATSPGDYGLSRRMIGLSHLKVMMWAIPSLFVVISLFVPYVSAIIYGVSAIEALMVVITAAMTALVACGARVHQAQGRTNYAAFLVNIIIPLSALCGLLTLVLAGVSVSALDLMAIYAGAALIVYISVVSIRYGGALQLFGVGRNALASSVVSVQDMRASNKLGVVVVAQQAISWTAFLVVPLMYGDSVYKGFVVSHKVAMLLSLVMLAVNFTLSSRFAVMYVEKRFGELRSMVKFAVAVILVSSIFAALFIMIFRDFVFDFSRIDKSMDSVLSLLLVGQIFFAVASLYSVVLSMCRDDDFLLIIQGGVSFLAAPVFVAASWFFDISIACFVFVLSYLVLAVTLGIRVRFILRDAEVESK